MPTTPQRSVALHWTALSVEALEALSDHQLHRASSLLGVQLTALFISPQSVRRWNRRRTQIRVDPTALPWITQVVSINDQVIGHAGFHGLPNEDGLVEVAYEVDIDHRGRGYATAMLHHLLQRAQQAPHVRTVRATIRPDNQASIATVAHFQFVRVGEQLDDIDGLEFVYEIRLR
jgi:[ribosomal protein S5]-alanine N-acetyltransferase